MVNEERAHAGRKLIVLDSQPLSLHSDLLEPRQAEPHAVESLLMVDRRHQYVCVDEAFCRLIGAQQEDLVGQPVGLSIGVDAYEEHIRPWIERAFAGEVTAALLRTTHEYLGPVQIACVCYPCLGQQGQIEFALVRLRDDWPREKLRLALQQRAQRDAALYALDRAQSDESQLEKIGALAVQHLLEITGCYAVVLRQTHSAYPMPDQTGAEWTTRQMAAATSNDPALKPGECIILPLQGQGMTLGELELQLGAGKTLSTELRLFVEAVVMRLEQSLFRETAQAQIQQYTASLERIAAERTQEVTRRRHAAIGLHDVLGMLISNQPLPAIVDYIVRQAETILGADAVAILQAQHGVGENAFAPLGIDDPYSSVTAADLSGVQGDLAKAVKQRRPLTGHSEQWGDSNGGRYHTHLVTPMVAADNLAGIVVYFFLAAREFTADEIETAMVLCEQVFFAVESDRLQQRAREGAAAQERERLARELHDAVAQSIYGLSLFVEAGRRHAASGQIERVEEYLQLMSETTQQTKKQMQLLLFELRPNMLEQIGLFGALQQRLEVVERRAGITATLDVTDHIRLPLAVEDGLYRISQEALNNALKHASAQNVMVRVRIDGDVVTLEIVDDGVGFTMPSVIDESSIGILHMRKRAAALNADLTIESAPCKGTRVAVTVLVPGIGSTVHNDKGNTSDH